MTLRICEWEDWLAHGSPEHDYHTLSLPLGHALPGIWRCPPGCPVAMFNKDWHDHAPESPWPHLKVAPEPTLEEVIAEYLEWANETFPTATPTSAVVHLSREVAELLDEPTDGEEQSDALMLLLHAAHLSGNDMKYELRRKLAINRARTWGKPDADGVVEHVRDE